MSDSEEEETDEEMMNFNSKFERIEYEVMKIARQKEKRTKKVEKINFQSKRLPNLSKKINVYFMSEKRNVVLKANILSHLSKH